LVVNLKFHSYGFDNALVDDPNKFYTMIDLDSFLYPSQHEVASAAAGNITEFSALASFLSGSCWKH
jgi:hypothetical protein